MRFLITTRDGEPPFFSPNFNPENHFNPETGMVVYDLLKAVYTIDGIMWQEIEEDHL